MERFTGLIGLAAILGVVWLASADRKRIPARTMMWGLGLQLGFAFLVLKTPAGKLFQSASVAVNALIGYAEAGSRFLFGKLGGESAEFGVIFAFQVLPIIIFIASLFAVLRLPRRDAGVRTGDGDGNVPLHGDIRSEADWRFREYLQGQTDSLTIRLSCRGSPRASCSPS
ncbi:MAG: Na+ dependent nucleoside transporter N-terminal domain-containing protein [Bryobacteraceae bacterium]